MSAIAAKFGGTSTANAAGFRRILEILKSGSYRCAVLSAPGTDDAHPKKITDLLGACWERRETDGGPLEEVIGRFREISRDLGIPPMDDGIAGAALRTALSDSRDHTLSRGEYLCALLFARYSGLPFVDSAEVIAFQPDGSLDVPASLRRLRSISAPVPIVLPGFYGADPLGRIHTFPRNGSDITGALAATGLGATVYENWTDVPGLMTADPALVPEARPIPRISYRQMRQLSRAGAWVLHPDCLSIVEAAGIPTRLRCTSRTDLPGTWIDGKFGQVVPCVTGRRGIEGRKSVSEIAVFSPESRVFDSIIDDIRPVRAAVDKSCLRMRVPSNMYVEALRKAHRALL